MRNLSTKYVIICIFSFLAFSQSKAQSSASIFANQTKGCAPLSVSFQVNGAENVNQYIWEFSNGVTSSLQEPVILFENPGDFDVKLTIVYNDNSSEIINSPALIHVNQKPVSDFEIDKNTACDGEPVSFKNNSLFSSTYLWDFGDGSNSSEKNPTHIYQNGGKYTVTLVAYSPSGCPDIKVMEDILEINQIKGLDFESDKNLVCNNDPNVAFAVSKDFASYKWDFGDTTFSSQKSPIHSFKNLRKYDVSLEVTDENGCKAKVSKSEYITVIQPSPVTIELSDTVVCRSQSVEFINKTKGTSEVAWSLSNNFSSASNQFIHQFDTAGIYDLNITVQDKNGCVQSKFYTDLIEVLQAEKTEINISETEGCTPLKVRFSNDTKDATQYHWEIGNKVFTDRSFELTFNDPGTISLIAQTEHTGGCISEVKMDSAVTVNESNISAHVTNTSGCLPLETAFNLSTDKVTNVLWNFGDGKTSADLSPKYRYEKPGHYEASVSFTNQFGCIDTIHIEPVIHVFDTTANFTKPDPIQLCAFEEVKFSGSIGKETWQWDFGDGATSTERDPLHQYTRPGTYYVKLATQNAHGCPVTINKYHKIIINGVTTSDFEYSVNECPDSVVSFSGSTDIPATYQWKFGDGNNGTGKDIFHQYENSGYYQIQLTTTDSFGCKMIKSKTILVKKNNCFDVSMEPGLDSGKFEVKDPEIPLIIQKTVEACSAPFEMAFPNPKTTASSWLWNFKDGSTSSEQFPVHTFQQPGTYEIDLFAYYDDGQIDSLVGFIQVIVYDQKVDFNYTSINLCDGTKVQFQDVSETPVTWQWDFGDGGTSIQQHPERLFKNSGIYQVNLVSADEKGCTKRTVHNVAIGNPNHYISFQEDLCAEDTLIIDHNINNFEQYTWDFGDGETFAGKFPTHLYANSGKYSISLSATDQNGCKKTFNIQRPVVVTKPVANFEIEGDTTGCGTLEVYFKNLSTGADSWLWEFGNGVISTEKNPVIEFSGGVFSVKLTAFKGMCSNTIDKKDIIVVEQMEANYSFTQDGICFPVTVHFKDESPDADSWYWNFGDGQTSTVQNPTHTFLEKPRKKALLKVTNSKGCKASVSEDSPEFYQSDFAVESESGCIPFHARFEDKSENALSWLWDFGDGSTSTEQHPEHVYEKEGTYTVSLITTSPTGCTDTLAREDLIRVGYLENSFSVDLPPSLCAPMIAIFDNSSVGATKYLWEFGDGSGSTLEDPVHVYSKVGQFDVQLIAMNDLGCRDTIDYAKLVTTLGPEADFELSDSLLCHPQEFQIRDLSASAIKWEWYFGDGGTSAEQNPVHQYDRPGSYSIALLATDVNGCQELKKFDSVKVIKTPEAHFNVNQLEYCMPALVEVDNSSKNLQNPSFKWDFGNGNSSEENSPKISYEKPGSYKVSLTVVNDSVCLDTYSLNNPINVRDTFYLKEPDVYQLTVQSDNEIDIKLNAYARNNLKYNLVYKKPARQSQYEVTDTLYDGMTTDYFDKDVATDTKDYSYIFQSHIYCQNPVPLSELTTYKSIYLEAAAGDSSILLTWTPYAGHKFDHYDILRKMDGGSWEQIAKLSPEKTTFSDTEDLCPTNYTYLIIARNLNGLDFHSMSNERSAKPKRNVFLDQQVEIVRTTVVDNTSVLTEWKDPEIGPDKVLYYQVWRADENGNFTLLNQMPNGSHAYYDKEARVEENSYTYKISVINTCDVQGKLSNKGKSILLKKETDQYINHLNWTEYEEWEDGVGEYLLQKKNENGEWETIEHFSPGTTSHTIDLSKED